MINEINLARTQNNHTYTTIPAVSLKLIPLNRDCLLPLADSILLFFSLIHWRKTLLKGCRYVKEVKLYSMELVQVSMCTCPICLSAR